MLCSQLAAVRHIVAVVLEQGTNVKTFLHLDAPSFVFSGRYVDVDRYAEWDKRMLVEIVDSVEMGVH